ncbi:MAG: glycerol-3-phosphate acyltransferase, partial [Brevibacillus sp.]
MLFLSWVISYLIGSISFSYLIAKKIAGIDIRAHGSGNAGATNTLRVLGKGPAVVVLVLDALKGLAAMGITNLLT